MPDPISPKRIRSITFSLNGETLGPRTLEVDLNWSGGGAAVLKIGRDVRSHLPLLSDSITRLHTVIEVDRDNTITVIDLGSGTKVDGQSINKAEIRVGTLVGVGDVTLTILSLQFDPVPEPKVETPNLAGNIPAPDPFVPPSPVVEQEPEVSFEDAPLKVLLTHYTHYMEEISRVARRTTAKLVRLARRIESEESE